MSITYCQSSFRHVSHLQHVIAGASRKSTLRQCEKSVEWSRSVKYLTERRFPHGGFEINFDLPLVRADVTGELVPDTYLDKEGQMKEAGSMAVLRGRMAPTEAHTARWMAWQNRNNKKKERGRKEGRKLEHVTRLCARWDALTLFPSCIGVYRTFARYRTKSRKSWHTIEIEVNVKNSCK